MDVFVSRQPIFDRNGAVFGYQLVCREDADSVFSRPGGNVAQTLEQSLAFMGLESLANGKRVFVNMTYDALVSGAVPAFKPEQAIVEIPENGHDDELLLAAAARLKDAGYELALPQNVDPAGPVLRLISYAKLDAALAKHPEVVQIVREMENAGIKVLGENVETHDDFGRCRRSGFSLLRGFFFTTRPDNDAEPAKDIPAFKAHYLAVMRQLQAPEIDIAAVEEIVRRELSLSYKALRYVNSAYYGLRTRIKSVRHALAMLGINEVRRLVSASVFTTLGHDKPRELVAQATVRARFCELLAKELGFQSRGDEFFTMGMWSLVDVILDRPMGHILREMPMASDIEAALLGEDNLPREVLECAIAYERGNWAELARKAASLRLTENAIPSRYAEAIDWCQQVFGGAHEPARAAA